MNDQDRISRIRADAEKILFKIPGVHRVGIAFGQNIDPCIHPASRS